MFELSELHWHGQGKENKNKKGKQQRTHTALAHCFSTVFITFSILFYTALSFFLAGVMERWDDANEYRYPPFFLFLSFISSSGGLVGRYVYLSGLLA
jgi:hypothetical protein